MQLAGPEQGDKPLVFDVKSTSTGTDLLYEFDELDRFRDSQPGAQRKPMENYLRLNALGDAVLFSSARNTLLSGTSLTYGDLQRREEQDGSQDSKCARRYIVLIDELDKAPRDTPNGLFLELEEMRFRVKETDAWVEGDPNHRPVAVITSNSEKSLPEPFLRRCAFHP